MPLGGSGRTDALRAASGRRFHSSWVLGAVGRSIINSSTGNLMLSKDAPSRAPLKSQPEPSTEAKLHREASGNRSGR